MGNKKNLADVGIFDYLEELKDIVKKLKQKPIIIGASMGGFLAQKLAEIEDILSIVLINSVPPKGVASKLWPTQKYANVGNIIKWSTESTLQDTIDCMPEADKKTILWAHPKWRDESGKVIKELRSGLPINKKKITGRVLVIAGGNDVDITPQVSDKIAQYYNADYFQFEGVSHVGALLGKRWKEIAMIVKIWIEKENV
jgi:pimeloyl-ACP methyl ester carboxylesterase